MFTAKNNRHVATIDILPDNVFLEIFDFYLCQPPSEPIQRTKKWQTLVHVCQRWRSIIFASPRRLDLYLSCSYGTRVRINLAYWPVTLPLIVDYAHKWHTPDDDDAILAALEHSGRVHRIKIIGMDSLLNKVAKIMQKPFPALSHLDIQWNYNGKFYPTLGSAPIIPRRFLGRSASRLQHLCLNGITLPHLPALLWSARNLVTLNLENVFQDGYDYISPKTLAEGLAMLPSLTTLSFTFHDETSAADQSGSRHDPPTILPSLTVFQCEGYSDYLEDFVTRIDTPRIDCFKIEYYAHGHQALQLSRFLDRTENLKLSQFTRARVLFSWEDFSFELDSPHENCCQAQLSLTMCESWIEMLVPYSAHILSQVASTFSNVDHLSAHGDQDGLYGMHSTEWLPFLRQFPAVETLHLSGGVAAYIVSALEHNADLVTDVLPALHLIWLEDEENDVGDVPVGSMEKFLSLRRLSGRPVTVVDTYDEFVEAADRNPLKLGAIYCSRKCPSLHHEKFGRCR